MKIVENSVPVMSIDEFADRHGLVMEVHERRVPLDSPTRFYAHFKDAEVMEPGMLVGAYGNGATKYSAIQEYARRISLARIAIRAGHSDRVDIDVPRLSEK